MSSDRSADDTGQKVPSDVVDRWARQAVEKINETDEYDDEILLLEMQTKLGELTQAILSNSSTGSLSRVDDELDELGGLLLQLCDRHHSDTRFNLAENQLTQVEPLDEETEQIELEKPSEDQLRDRAESLVEQGVSSVSKISDIILKEFDNVDRFEINQIASEVRSEAGEMETRGDIGDITGSDSR